MFAVSNTSKSEGEGGRVHWKGGKEGEAESLDQTSLPSRQEGQNTRACFRPKLDSDASFFLSFFTSTMAHLPPLRVWPFPKSEALSDRSPLSFLVPGAFPSVIGEGFPLAVTQCCGIVGPFPVLLPSPSFPQRQTPVAPFKILSKSPTTRAERGENFLRRERRPTRRALCKNRRKEESRVPGRALGGKESRIEARRIGLPLASPP